MYAEKPQEAGLMKRLWLMIAQHVVQEKKDIKSYVFDFAFTINFYFSRTISHLTGP